MKRCSARNEGRKEVFFSLLPEFFEKAKNYCTFLLRMLLIGVLLVCLFGAIYTYRFNGLDEVFSSETLKVGIWLLFDFAPGKGEFENFDSLVYVGHFLGFLYACIISGMSVAILSAPINVIKFSRYAILDFKKRKLIFRYWIRKPEGKYLNDVSISVEFSNPVQRNTGLAGAKRYFRHNKPAIGVETPRGVYNIQRGVWYTEISFDELSHDKKNHEKLFNSILRQSKKIDKTSEEAKASYSKTKRWKRKTQHNKSSSSSEIFLTIKGINENGNLVMRRQAYTFDKLLLNYRFVSIRPPEIANRYPHGNAANSSRTYSTVHFDVVNKIEYNSDEFEKLSQYSYLFGEPRTIDVLQKGDCITHPLVWRIESALWDVAPEFLRKRLFSK